MGIPRFFKYLSTTYPKLLSRKLQLKKNAQIEGLYIDVNTPLHEICGIVFRYNIERELTEIDRQIQTFFRNLASSGREDITLRILFDIIGQYLIYCYSYVQPKKTFMIAIDGPAPAAKMTQQRSRRFKSTSSVLDFFDSTMISAGTRFMDALDQYISTEWIKKYKSLFPMGLDLIYSCHREAGEGEHKLFDQMNHSLKNQDTTRKANEFRANMNNTYQVVVGADSDLIILSMAKKTNVIFMRHSILTGAEKKKAKTESSPLQTAVDFFLMPQCSPNPPNPDDVAFLQQVERMWTTYFETGFVYVDIAMVRENLMKEYLAPNDIMDFALISMFVGNDFLPAIPEIEVVVMESPMVYSDFDIRDRVKLIYREEQIRKNIPKEKRRPFRKDEYEKSFSQKSQTWNKRDAAKTIDYVGAEGFFNPIDNQFEMFPLVKDSFTGSWKRVFYRKTNGDRRWFPVVEDIGCLSRCLAIYRNMMSDSGGRKLSQGNKFLVERKNRINYVNLLEYLKILQVRSDELLKAHMAQQEIAERIGVDGNPLVEMSVGKSGRHKAMSVSAYVGAYRRIAFGIYDSVYADPELPKQTVDDMCRKWLEGAQWTLRYYSDGFKSINTKWFYPYQRSPSINDLVTYLTSRMTVSVSDYPGIHVPTGQSTVDVQRIRIDGLVNLDESGNVVSINSKFHGVLYVYVDSIAQTIALLKHYSGESKYVDYKMLNFVRAPRKLLYSGGGDEQSTSVQGAIAGKINFVSDSRDNITVNVERTFQMEDDIYRVIADVSSPYATTVESMFSIMPPRVLKLIMTPELVDEVIVQITDYFPDTVEIIADGKFYQSESAPNLPKVSPTRIQRAIDAVSSKYDVEISRLNMKKPRVAIVHKSHTLDFQIIGKKTRYGKPGAQTGLKIFGYAEENIAKKTRKRQDIVDYEKVESRTGGGYGTVLGKILPQHLGYFSQLRSTHVGPRLPEEKKITNDVESLEIAKFANVSIQMPGSFGLPSADLPFRYDIIPTTLPYRPSQVKDNPDFGFQLAMNERRKLLNEVIFLNIFSKQFPKVVVCGVNPTSFSRWSIIARLFPNVSFDLWEPRRITKTDFSQLKNVKLIGRYLLGPMGGVEMMKFISKDILEYRKQRILFIADLEVLPNRFESDSKNISLFNDVQARMVDLLNPVASLLKLRVPYDAPKDGYECLDGLIFLQTWGSARSAEVRLLVLGNNKIEIPMNVENAKKYWGLDVNNVSAFGQTMMIQKRRLINPVDYENKLYYYNVVLRNRVKVFNSLAMNVRGFKDTWESGFEISVWRQYNQFKGTSGNNIETEKEEVSKLIQDVDVSLGFTVDGKIMNPEAVNVVKSQLEKPVFVTYSDIAGIVKPGSSQDKSQGKKNVFDLERQSCLSEVQFLNGKKSRIVVIYSKYSSFVRGAFLASLFPRKTFIFFSMEDPKIKMYGGIPITVFNNLESVNWDIFGASGQIIVIKQDLYHISAAELRERLSDDILLIVNGMGQDLSGLNNGRSLMREMNPVATSLSFRVPKLEGAKFQFCPGVVNLLAWGQKMGMDTQLHVMRENINTDVEYPDGEVYESAMTYFNTIARPGNDSLLETYIWNEYLAKNPRSGTVKALQDTLTYVIGKVQNKSFMRRRTAQKK